MPPPASIVIPTRARLPYLEVALASIAPAAAQAGVEVLVVDDAGPSHAARELAERFGARYEPHSSPLGLNVARNTGVSLSTGELVVFVDDDVRVGSDWLGALLRAAGEHPDVDVFTGPITARLEGQGGWSSHSCGREQPPITTLDLGAHDTDARFAWGANMAIRRAALERVGAFDVSLEHGGDEQEWQERLRTLDPGARVLYVADASVEHRRSGDDARLRSLARGAYRRGRAARRFDARRGQAPSRAAELATLAGCLGHVVRRRCPAGLTMAAHSWGRLREGIRERAQPATGAVGQPAAPDDFLSGTSGTVGGIDGLRRAASDEAVDAWEILSARRLRLELAARHAPSLRRVLALGVVRPERRMLAKAIEAELLSSRHDVELHTCPAGGRGKFENLNLLLAAQGGGRAGGLRSRTTTGCWCSTTTWSCRGASSTASCSCASASRSCWHSPPTGCTRTPPGRSPGAGRGASCARRASWRSGPSRLSLAPRSRRCCRSPSCAWAGAWTCTGRRSHASRGGVAASSTPSRSATKSLPPPPTTRARTPSPRRARSSPSARI